MRRIRVHGIAHWSLVAMAVTALNGCLGSQNEPSPTSSLAPAKDAEKPPLPTDLEYRFEPWDMMTAVGESPLRVLVAGSSVMPLPEDQLERLRAAVSLRTWPELAEVPAKVRIEHARTSRPGTSVARLVLDPNTPLSDRWYALYVEQSPEGFALARDPSNAFRASSGAHLSRFRVGSEPVLVSVRQSQAPEDKYLISFDFSERVQGTSPELLKALSLSGPAGDSSSCTPARDTEKSFRSLHLTCRKQLLVPGAQVQVASDALRSIAGRTMRRLKAQTDNEQVVDVADGSRFLRVGLRFDTLTAGSP
jgi:hypothetical protein